jgi:hypothetical protein
MTCEKSTVRQPLAGVYTVHCTGTYSDSSVWAGIASVLIKQDKTTWEPTGLVSHGSGV